MPEENGMAFVVVQHLSPDFKSLMDELLSHRTKMPIYRVEHGMEVKPDAIYLIPPKKEMIISGGKLLLTDKDPSQGLTLPIDQFFRSLAQDIGRDAIGIILSGTGSDGSRGIRDIHDAGGLVIVQSEETAKFDGMPKSAIDTGVVDFVLSPEKMPHALLKYVKHPISDKLAANGEPRVAETGLNRLFQVLREQHGIDFTHYKPSTVSRRIERRLLMNQTVDLDAYVEQLRQDTDELNSLYKDLLIGVTKFFRDPDAFHRLGSDILPGLLLKIPPGEEFRVWVSGCATGEEAYSLAMLIHEQIEAMNRSVKVKIFATDVHRESIDFASAGIYSAESLSEITPSRLERYFVRKGRGYQISQELRQMIVFAHHNIIRDAPFTNLHLITCRNLLIYLQPNAQKKVISLFHFGLTAGGVLFLGPSESPAELEDEFEVADPHWKMYRKRRDIKLPTDMRLPLTITPSQFGSGISSLGGRNTRTDDSRISPVYQALLDQFVPPSLLINANRELMHTFGGAEKFLHLQGGRTSTNILDLVDADLRVLLSGAMNRALKELNPVQFDGVTIQTSAGQTRLKLGVRPIPDRTANTTQMLITLEDLGMQSPTNVDDHAVSEINVDLSSASRDRLNELESELRYTRENLQATVEELETSNEELQATNEELVASNEELQSTNEELHSVNEELYTVNAEYQRKIAELTQLNNDMDNLLHSTEIGTIFIDRDLCIRKFTPQIADAFHLLPQDVGRRIDTFAHNINEPDLLNLISQVLQSGQSCEREVQDRKQNWYLLRIFPYRASSDEIHGVVLSLIDVSQLKSTEARLLDVNRQLTGILDNSATFIYVKDLSGTFQICNRAGLEMLGAGSEEVCGKTDYDYLPVQTADLIQGHDREVATRGYILEFEETYPTPNGPQTYLSIKFPLRNEAGRIDAIGAVCTRITERKRIEEEQRLAVARRDQFLAMLSHELRNPLGAIINAVQIMDRKPDAKSLNQSRIVISRQGRLMSRLLDDLLDVSRVTQGKIELKKTVFDLRLAAEDAVESVAPAIEKRQQKFTVDFPDEPLYVEGDRARLQQILGNLLTNASKYTQDGGSIRISISRESDMAVIRVRDDGIGIPENEQDNIFDLFVQSQATVGHADGGMGVGLTLVRSIVEKHGGQVSVHSEGLGRGSEFTVSLPLTKKLPVENQEVHKASLPQCHIAKVLIIEDNDDARTTMAQLLEIEGFEVLVSPDGGTGLKVIENERPHIVL
ncbi:MAG: ATP-binding protein, partial [Planctomycetota bacterium]|nr:ATP-binding protein [Planctomycetota bacterium]